MWTLMNHEPDNIFQARWWGLEDRFTPRMPKPTKVLPGTQEKVKIMTQRAVVGEELFHTLDPVFPIRGGAHEVHVNH